LSRSHWASAVALALGIGSILYWPALAVLGNVGALAAMLFASLALLDIATLVFSPRFGDHAIAAASSPASVSESQVRRRDFDCERQSVCCATRNGRSSSGILGWYRNR